MMQIGSNNSFSYLNHKGWWNTLTKPFDQYQTINYEKQYRLYGIRMFDVGLAVNKQGKLILRYNGKPCSTNPLYEAFDFFDKCGDVRVNIFLDETFEERMYDDKEDIIRKFKEYCHNLEFLYKNIIFYGGYRKFDMKQIYTFDKKDEEELKIININENFKFYSIITRIFPCFRKMMNKKYINMWKNKYGYILLNFADEK